MVCSNLGLCDLTLYFALDHGSRRIFFAEQGLAHFQELDAKTNLDLYIQGRHEFQNPVWTTCQDSRFVVPALRLRHGAGAPRRPAFRPDRHKPATILFEAVLGFAGNLGLITVCHYDMTHG